MKRLIFFALLSTVLSAAYFGPGLVSSSGTAHAFEIVGLGNKCLDVFGGNPVDAMPIILFQCHGAPNQQWSLQPNGAIRGLGNKCLDVFGGNVADGAQLILFQCHGGINQQFRFQ